MQSVNANSISQSFKEVFVQALLIFVLHSFPCNRALLQCFLLCKKDHGILPQTYYNEADKMGDIHMYMYINKQINNKMQRHCLNNEDWAALQHNESSDWKASAILLIVFVSKVESSE